MMHPPSTRISRTLLVTFLSVLSLGLTLGCSDDEKADLLPTPPGFDGSDGAACAATSDCKGTECLSRLAGWPDGYCTTLECDDSTCGDNSRCTAILDGTRACLQLCDAPADCRQDYDCLPVEDAAVCLPSEGDGPRSGEFGSRCDSDEDCNGVLECETSVQGGYCLSRDCDSCDQDSTCGELTDTVSDVCLQACEDTLACRLGFVCRQTDDSSACVPSEASQPDVSFETTSSVLGIHCDSRPVGTSDLGTRYQIDFDVSADASSFVVVPFVERGQISPVAILGPNDLNIDLIDAYRHHNLRASEISLYDLRPIGTYATIAFDWPIHVPYAPQFADFVREGTYTINVTTDASPPCVYVVESGEGTRLDLNIHLVGIDYRAATAAQDPDFVEVLEQVSALYGQAGIELGEVRFFDAPEEIEERYTIVRQFEDVKRLTAFSEAPGPTLDEHLSVDVFLVEDIVISGANVLGLSASVPGAPGMHGNAGNGLVFGTADLGFDNTFVALIMAHEIGHYLGLRHTTEIVHNLASDAAEEFARLVDTTDPFEDTPECSAITRQGRNCPDATNLMFPAAPDDGSGPDPILSDDQGTTLRLSPLVK